MALANLKDLPSVANLIPDGTYRFQVLESTLKATKSGNGKYIAVTLECLDEAFAKRRIWTNFNIDNPSPQAQAIGLRQLKSLLEAAGANADELNSPEELLGLQVRASVGHDHRPPYDATNTIRKFLLLNEEKQEEPAF